MNEDYSAYDEQEVLIQDGLEYKVTNISKEDTNETECGYYYQISLQYPA